jgi:hypothetical protein
MILPTDHLLVTELCRRRGLAVPVPGAPGSVTGRAAEVLTHMQGAALQLIQILVLEKAGIRDGDGV